jgi:hypothetical protein
MKTIDMGNNEAVSIGVERNNDGTFTALTLTASKTFKTEDGAARWLAARGYNANGSRAVA